MNLIRALLECCTRIGFDMVEADLRCILASTIATSQYHMTAFALENKMDLNATEALDIEKYICSKFYTGNLGVIVQIVQSTFKCKISVVNSVDGSTYEFAGVPETDKEIPHIVLTQASPTSFKYRSMHTYIGKY